MNKDRSLHETIEIIRQLNYNHIPKELIDSILKIQEESLEYRQDASKEISKLIEAYLENK